jgi:hypothetical protein
MIRQLSPATADPFLSRIAARYIASEAAAAAHRDAIRRGDIPPDPPADGWLISDRH